MFDEPMEFDDSFDKDIRDALKINEADTVDVWPSVRGHISDRVSILDYLAPLLSAAAALAIAWSLTGTSASSPWPINDTVKQVPMADVNVSATPIMDSLHSE